MGGSSGQRRRSGAADGPFAVAGWRGSSVVLRCADSRANERFGRRGRERRAFGGSERRFPNRHRTQGSNRDCALTSIRRPRRRFRQPRRAGTRCSANVERRRSSRPPPGARRSRASGSITKAAHGLARLSQRISSSTGAGKLRDRAGRQISAHAFFSDRAREVPRLDAQQALRRGGRTIREGMLGHGRGASGLARTCAAEIQLTTATSPYAGAPPATVSTRHRAVANGQTKGRGRILASGISRYAELFARTASPRSGSSQRRRSRSRAKKGATGSLAHGGSLLADRCVQAGARLRGGGRARAGCSFHAARPIRFRAKATLELATIGRPRADGAAEIDSASATKYDQSPRRTGLAAAGACSMRNRQGSAASCARWRANEIDAPHRFSADAREGRPASRFS